MRVGPGPSRRATSPKLAKLYQRLAEIDAQLTPRDEDGAVLSDYTISEATGCKPVSDDLLAPFGEHKIDAHEHKEQLAAKRSGPEKPHLKRQGLVEAIDVERHKECIAELQQRAERLKQQDKQLDPIDQVTLEQAQWALDVLTKHS